MGSQMNIIEDLNILSIKIWKELEKLKRNVGILEEEMEELEGWVV